MMMSAVRMGFSRSIPKWGALTAVLVLTLIISRYANLNIGKREKGRERERTRQ